MKKLKQIEAVKYLTAVWICLYHIRLLIFPELDGPVANLGSWGYLGVNIFLILSGFGLTLSTLRAESRSGGKAEWRKFFVKRLIRIYPLYIFLHILFCVMGAMLGKYQDMPLDFGFLLSITGLRVFFPAYFWYGPDAFWYVGLILQFYLLFPLLFTALKEIGSVYFLVLSAVLTAIFRSFTGYSEHAYVFMLGLSPNRLGEFSLGVVLGSFVFSYLSAQANSEICSPVSYIKRTREAIMALLIVFVLCLLFWMLPANVDFVLADLVQGAIAFIAILGIASVLSFQDHLLKLLCHLGFVSYAFYLFHSPPIRPAFHVLNGTLGINLWSSTVIYIIIVTFVSIFLTKLDVYFLSLIGGTLERRKIL